MSQPHSSIHSSDSSSHGNADVALLPDHALVVKSHQAVQEILSDKCFEVPEPDVPQGPVGTVSWLRASVVRFSNGNVHDTRLAVVREELERLDPDELGIAARERTSATIDLTAPDCRAEMMASLAHRIPMEVMASALRFTEVTAAATAVMTVAGSYFPGSPPEMERAADECVTALLEMCGPVELEVAVARIAIMVQACDATAALIESALQMLEESTAGTTARWPTKELLVEVVRCCPPARFSRRVLREASTAWDVPQGGLVLCDVHAANRDPAVHDRPDLFDPFRPERPSLTFGYGIRPCPAQTHALSLAEGVVEAVRRRAHEEALGR